MSIQSVHLADIVVPEAPAPKMSGGAASTGRKAGSGSFRIGVLDNSKANADYLLAMLIERLRLAYPIESVCSVRKDNPSFPAPPEIIEQLAKEADFVFTAMAD